MLPAAAAVYALVCWGGGHQVPAGARAVAVRRNVTNRGSEEDGKTDCCASALGCSFFPKENPYKVAAFLACSNSRESFTFVSL
jgi:hypothetical protein